MTKTQLGPFSLYTIETGRFRLDGGAMFGVVPKTLWSRQIEADDQNRIPMAMRCLLIHSSETGKMYLVDNGIGTKLNEKLAAIYQVDHQHSNLPSSLAYHGFEPEEITDIIFTHLHFDHCGGTTYYDEAGELNHTFPNARYHVTKNHWKTATKPNVREKASFLEENIGPIEAWGQLDLVDENHEFEKGLIAIPVNGHTMGQQLPVIKADGKIVVFAGDLIPTHVHVPLPWIMGYDMRPIKTLEEKKVILGQAGKEKWYFYMEHDAQHEVIQVKESNEKFMVSSRLTLDEI